MKDKLDDATQKYLEEMGYSGRQSALFLLGTLIGSIGIEQSKIGGGTDRKPILNKVNFSGMPLSKVLRLSNEIFEKLRQYKVLDYSNETTFAVMRHLFDMYSDDWDLTPQDNVYYILSGYAYKTLRVLHHRSFNG